MPGSFQAMLKVVRRKSSPLGSPASPVAAGVHTCDGAFDAIPSAGSSNVHDVAVSVYVTPRRSIVHGVPDPSPRACSRVFTRLVVMSS